MNPLSAIAVGECKTVVGFQTPDESVQRKLVALGIMPGIELVLEQRFPSYIVKIGYTRTAIDRETAQSIFVE